VEFDTTEGQTGDTIDITRKSVGENRVVLNAALR